MNVEFALSLSARLDWMHYRVLSRVPGCEDKAAAWKARSLSAVCEMAEGEAWEVSPLYGEIVPTLFADVPELSAAYIDFFQYSVVERDRYRRLQKRLKAEFYQKHLDKVKTEHVNRLVIAGRWSELGLPKPETLLERLLEGSGQRLENHYVDFDVEDGVTWLDKPCCVTVPYCGVPELSDCVKLLTSIAHQQAQ